MTLLFTADESSGSGPVPGCDVIYEPRGQAGEYAALAVNVYRGCGNKCAYCLRGDTLIQMSDGATKPIGSIRIGDSIIGVTIDRSKRAWGTRITTTTVLAKITTRKQAYRIALEDGTEAFCSADHRWLTERGWKYTASTETRPTITTNNLVRKISDAILTPSETESYRLGYIAGMIEGDGRKFELEGQGVSSSVKVASVESLNESIEMFDIMTGTENFIANGMISHNCYVPLVTKQKREEFDAGAVERPDFLRKLLKDAAKYQNAGRSDQVMLSFTTDPYPPTTPILTRRTLEILRDHGLAFCTLTKGGTRAFRDIDLFRPTRDAFASTLTSLNDEFSLKWEREAALPGDRIKALKKFHGKGIFTWVSLEPTLDCESSLSIIKRTHKFVDLYKIGRANYLPMTKETDWREYTLKMMDLCGKLGVKHYFKKDLQPYLPAGYVNVLRQEQHN